MKKTMELIEAIGEVHKILKERTELFQKSSGQGPTYLDEKASDLANIILQQAQFHHQVLSQCQKSEKASSIAQETIKELQTMTAKENAKVFAMLFELVEKK